jgi:hypothetical protein
MDKPFSITEHFCAFRASKNGSYRNFLVKKIKGIYGSSLNSRLGTFRVNCMSLVTGME